MTIISNNIMTITFTFRLIPLGKGISLKVNVIVGLEFELA